MTSLAKARPIVLVHAIACAATRWTALCGRLDTKWTLSPCFVAQRAQITSHGNEAINMADLKLELQVPFPSEKEARIAYNSLVVDPEPKRGGTKKTLFVEENVLHVSMISQEPRSLRVASNSFMDHLILVTKTLEMFGPPLAENT